MNNRILILTSIVLALLQGPFLPGVFLEGLLVVVRMGVNKSTRDINVLVGLFASGLIFDLVQGKMLGATSLIFGVGALIFSTMGARGNLMILAVGALIIDLARSRILFGQFLVVPSLLCLLIVYFFFKFVRSGELGQL